MWARTNVLAVGVILGSVGCGGSAEPAPGAPPVALGGEDLMPPQHYRAELEDGTLRMTLWLPPAGEPRRIDLPDFPGREARRDLVRDVSCDGDPLAAAPGGGWIAPRGCETLTWRVEPDDAAGETVDPAVQRAVAGEGWWWLPGASIFVGPEGERTQGTLDLSVPEGVPVYHSLRESDRLGVRLPGAHHVARVMIGIGDFTERTTSDGRTRYRNLYAGEPPANAGSTTEPHAQGTSYLARVTGAEPPRSVDVFWFGRDPSDRTVTGASGVDAIAAAHYTEELPEDAPAHARHAPLMVLLHEHFHLLTGSRLPEWANESLAQYFALRAMVHARLMTEEELEAFLAPFAEDDGTPLLEETRRGHYYTRGAAYWHALHRGIAGASRGERGLDDALPLILDLVFVEGGRPPARYFGVLTGNGLDGETARAITHRYLGWPEPEPEPEPDPDPDDGDGGEREAD